MSIRKDAESFIVSLSLNELVTDSQAHVAQVP